MTRNVLHAVESLSRTRREYIPVGSVAASLPQTVLENDPTVCFTLVPAWPG